MREAGVWAVPYHPYRFWRPHFWTLIRRNHRKTLVCDGAVAFTGGINISDMWSPESEGGAGWHDAAVEVRGPAVATIEAVLLRTWNWRARRRLRLKVKHLVQASSELATCPSRSSPTAKSSIASPSGGLPCMPFGPA
jgi:phosphatidylserine/phosphatidylglycerophosphate/cardiolipin synthase-like enzyme